MKSTRESDRLERYGFVLDIDENILITEFEPGEKTHLSQSAAQFLSRSSEGIVKEPEVEPGMRAFRVIALRRAEWEDFFLRVAEINERYQTLSGDKRPLIYCMFLTNAKYTADGFKNIFKQLYGEDLAEKIIPDPDVTFFNRQDQLSAMGKPDKGAFLAEIHSHFAHQLGIDYKKNITLIDDLIENITSARQHGFSAIHHPTSLYGRRGTPLTFTQHGIGLFDLLHDMLDKSDRYVKALEEEVALHRRKRHRKE